MKKPLTSGILKNFSLKNKYAFYFSLIFIFLLSSLLTIKFIIKAQNGTVTIQPGTLITATSCLNESMDRIPARCTGSGGCINHTYTYDQYDPEQDPYMHPESYVDLNKTLTLDVWGACPQAPVRNTVQVYGNFPQNVLTGHGDAIIQLTGIPRYQITSSLGCAPNTRAVTTRFDYTDAVCPRRPGGGSCLSGFTISGEKFKSEEDSSDICSPCDASPDDVYMCQQGGGTYDWSSCQCGQSPIVIDVLGNGFNLTDAANGVNFDINGDGTQDHLAWSSTNSDDAWLALDRNGNGTIDSGKELFGNSTPQPAPPVGEMKNGFLALAVFDRIQNGGNEDGIISGQDLVFANLRLWQDANHNGISETGELKTLAELGLAKIDLEYQDSRRTDGNGNRFRYKARVRDVQGAQIGRWAWDVYLAVQLPNN